jgi:hypothetical protein
MFQHQTFLHDCQTEAQETCYRQTDRQLFHTKLPFLQFHLDCCQQAEKILGKGNVHYILTNSGIYTLRVKITVTELCEYLG